MLKTSCVGGLDPVFSNWRKVASTHNLAELIADQEPLPAQSARSNFWLGLMFVFLGTILVYVEVFAFWSLSYPAQGALGGIAFSGASTVLYYAQLVPLSGVVAVIAVALNWFCLKISKHNS